MGGAKPRCGGRTILNSEWVQQTDASQVHRDAQCRRCSRGGGSLGSAEKSIGNRSMQACAASLRRTIPRAERYIGYYSSRAHPWTAARSSFTWSRPDRSLPPDGSDNPSDPFRETITQQRAAGRTSSACPQRTRRCRQRSRRGHIRRSQAPDRPQTQGGGGFSDHSRIPIAGIQAWRPRLRLARWRTTQPDRDSDDHSRRNNQVLPVTPPRGPGGGGGQSRRRRQRNPGRRDFPPCLARRDRHHVGWEPDLGRLVPGQFIPGRGRSGEFWPLWDTKANRIRTAIRRLSLRERYGTPYRRYLRRRAGRRTGPWRQRFRSPRTRRADSLGSASKVWHI